MKKLDERNTMFSRLNLKVGTKNYNDYYSKNPHLEEIDKNLRDNKDICGPSKPTYDPLVCSATNANFILMSKFHHLTNMEKANNKLDLDEREVSEFIKKLVLHYGASDVAIVKLEDYHYYSHRGRQDSSYGTKISDKLKHKYAIIFTIAMDLDIIKTAPSALATLEVSFAYTKGSMIGLQIGELISQLGHNSFVHMDGNYLLNLCRVANDSPMGEMGRNSLFYTPTNGSCLRLGAITTNMPLIIDENIDYNIKELCEICKRCAISCPVQAIEMNDFSEFSINQEKCFTMWNNTGTDCGICIASCPLSHKIDTKLLKTPEGRNQIVDDIIKEKGEKQKSSPLIDTHILK